MDARRLIFGVSLAFNVLGLATGVHLLVTRSDSPSISELATDSAARQTTADLPPRPNAEENFQWAQLESTNYSTYVGNLRKAGCPEETVDDIIVAEITRLYAPKIFAARQKEEVKRHYWQPLRSFPHQVFAAQQRAIEERDAVINELIGIDFDEYNRRMYPEPQNPEAPLIFLTEGKQKALELLEKKYGESEAQIRSSAHGIITDEDRSALSALHQQKEAEINALLTPDEQFEWGVRESPASARLARDLEAFQPTESEFRAIYDAKIALDRDSQVSLGTNSTESMTDPEAEFGNKLKSALGEQRFEEYGRSKDPGYQALRKIGDRFGLPEDAATKVLNLKAKAESQAAQVKTESDLNVSQKQDSLQTLRDQTIANVMTVLGDSGYSAYRDYGGTWVDGLAN